MLLAGVCHLANFTFNKWEFVKNYSDVSIYRFTITLSDDSIISCLLKIKCIFEYGNIGSFQEPKEKEAYFVNYRDTRSEDLESVFLAYGFSNLLDGRFEDSCVIEVSYEKNLKLHSNVGTHSDTQNLQPTKFGLGTVHKSLDAEFGKFRVTPPCASKNFT